MDGTATENQNQNLEKKTKKTKISFWSRIDFGTAVPFTERSLEAYRSVLGRFSALLRFPEQIYVLLNQSRKYFEKKIIFDFFDFFY